MTTTPVVHPVGSCGGALRATFGCNCLASDSPAGAENTFVDLNDFGAAPVEAVEPAPASTYVPRFDPNEPRIQDRLEALDGEPPTHDAFGHPLDRGGFYRNHVGAPMVTDPSGALTADGRVKFIPYGAPSSAGVKSSTTQLNDWSQRIIMRAYATDPELAAWGGALLRNVEPDSKEEREALTAIVNEAKVVGRIKIAADRGNCLHWVSEQVDTGGDYHRGDAIAAEVDFTPDDLDRFANSYRQVIADTGLKVESTEISLVNDTYRKAGTADRVVTTTKPLTGRNAAGEEVTVPAGVRLIADVKTGTARSRLRGRGKDKFETPEYRGGYAAQMATYAGSVPYDRITGERGDWGGSPPSQDYGLIIQIESASVLNGGDPDVRVELVDLEKGREYVEASNDLKVAEKAADRSAAYVSR